MKNLFTALLFSFLVYNANAQQSGIPLIPQPSQLTLGNSSLKISGQTTIALPKEKAHQTLVDHFREQLSSVLNTNIKTNAPLSKNSISFVIKKDLPREAYQLDVTKKMW